MIDTTLSSKVGLFFFSSKTIGEKKNEKEYVSSSNMLLKRKHVGHCFNINMQSLKVIIINLITVKSQEN